MDRPNVTLAAMPRADIGVVLRGPVFARRAQRQLGRAHKGMTFSAICAMAVLIALPSVGSRLEDATINAEMRSRLVMASIQHSNPRTRNQMMIDTPEIAPAQVASLGHDHAVALRSAAFVQPVRPAEEAEMRPLERPAHLGLAAAPEQSLRPLTRPATLAKPNPARLSTSGAVAAPMYFNPDLAPIASARPKARPAGLESRVVQYSRNWLRSVSERELNAQETCLATAIYHEARGEGIRGQFAVAEVILNRVASRKFPNTICGVVYQGVKEGRIGGCQFSFACDGRPEVMPNRSAAKTARRIAQVLADGGHRGLTQGALYFHTHQVTPGWSHRFTQTTQIGAHLFYRG